MSSEEYDMSFKVLVLGESGVGKSCIVRRYVHNTYDDDSIPTVGTDFARKLVKTPDGFRVNLMVWDTAGQERFRSLTTSFYRGVHAFFVVYDVSDPQSFRTIEYWLEQIKVNATLPDALRILVANKIDLRDSSDPDSGRVFVSRAEGMQFAREHGMLFFECSALTCVGVQQAFEEVVCKILEEPALRDDGTVAPKAGVELKSDSDANPDASSACYYC